jgi:hypothetical protein
LIGRLLWDQYARAEQREQERREALAQCRRWADKLGGQTTDAGVFVRWQGKELPETDPWGQGLTVSYRQGGLAESLTVRSAGPDGEPYTDDDITETRTVVNFKGLGHGIKQGVGDVSRRAARGLVRGLGEGVREQVKGGRGQQGKE